MKTKLYFFVALLACDASQYVNAGDCSDYPYGRGTEVIPIEGASVPKILATSRVAPFSDDISDVDDALDEATMMAKAEISKFMSEVVSSEETRNKMIDRMSVVDGEDRQAVSVQVDKITKAFSSQSKAMLRGVVVLGDCYTPGKEVRVTVGLKPETLAMAAGLADGTSDSLKKSSTPTSGATSSNGASEDSSVGPTQSGKIRRTEGQSNTKNLDNF